ncbi:MAG TPA: MEDS domain-containing protein, partial [Usitatibacter sp.]
MSALPNLTDCGLDGVNAIPYGVHMCHFYEGREDLVAALVPYFSAGLCRNERCIWITADPLDAADAQDALRNAGLDVDSVIRSGALVIRDQAGWYDVVDPSAISEMVSVWLEAERSALAEGYSGLRIAGNTSFVTPAHWLAFMEYEERIGREFATRRIVTLCSYRLAQCAATDLLDAARNHHCMLDRTDRGWQVFTARHGGAGSFVAPRSGFGSDGAHAGA